MSFFKNSIIFIIIIVVILYTPYWYNIITRDNAIIPGNQYKIIDNFISKEHQLRLIKIFKKYKYHTAHSEQTCLIDNIGEIQSINNDGSCSHPLLIPTKNGTYCRFASRIDIGLHQVKTGGYEGDKSTFDRIVTRLLIFEKYQFSALKDPNHEDYKDINSIFDKDIFRENAKEICGKDKPFYEPYSLTMGIHTPGQVSPIHLDISFYYGASRFLYPSWLLIVMEKSGLYKDRRIPQVQAITYLHNWEWKSGDGGEFLWYNKGIGYEPIKIEPKSNRAVLTDGSTTVHGSTILKPYKRFKVLNKDINNELIYVGNNTWHVLENGKFTGQIWNDNDLRFVLILRMRCHESLEDKLKYDPRIETDLSIDKIKSDLINDLKKKNKLKLKDKNGNNIDWMSNENALELGKILLDVYVKYPYPYYTSWIPINYCGISRLHKSLNWMEPYLAKYICNKY